VSALPLFHLLHPPDSAASAHPPVLRRPQTGLRIQEPLLPHQVLAWFLQPVPASDFSSAVWMKCGCLIPIDMLPLVPDSTWSESLDRISRWLVWICAVPGRIVYSFFVALVSWSVGWSALLGQFTWYSVRPKIGDVLDLDTGTKDTENWPAYPYGLWHASLIICGLVSCCLCASGGDALGDGTKGRLFYFFYPCKWTTTNWLMDCCCTRPCLDVGIGRRSWNSVGHVVL